MDRVTEPSEGTAAYGIPRLGAGASTRLPVVVATAALVVLAAVFLVPFYWMVISAFRPIDDTIRFPIQLGASRLTLDNFARLLADTNYPRTLANSIIIAVASAGSAAMLCTAAGYAFALLRFPGRQLLFGIVLGTMIVPSTVLLVPNFFVLSKLQLLDTWLALILPNAAPAVGIFWMRQYIKSAIDHELLDAARVDGAGEWRVFLQIVLPLVRPGVAALAIFITALSWNDFVQPFIYLSTQDLQTFPVRLVQFFPNLGQFQVPYDLIMAGATLALVPVLVVFLRFQRYFVAGITLGSKR